MPPRQHYVYIMANHARNLYTGMSSNLRKRVWQHRRGVFERSFTRRYRFTKLVYYEVFPDRRSAAARERQIKGWTRAKKIQLIESVNYGWEDLAAGWFEDSPSGKHPIRGRRLGERE